MNITTSLWIKTGWEIREVLVTGGSYVSDLELPKEGLLATLSALAVPGQGLSLILTKVKAIWGGIFLIKMGSCRINSR